MTVFENCCLSQCCQLDTIIDMMYVMYVVDQSKQCAQIYLQKIACCLKLQLLMLFFVKSIISDMHHRISYMYINFQQNQVSKSVKTVHTNLCAKNCQLHTFVTCNLNFEKSRLSDMHYPLTDIQTDFEINRQFGYLITAKRNYFHRRTDGQTDGQTSLTTTISSFFEKRKKY